MYNPAHFKNSDRETLNQVIDQYPFATLICGSEVTHLPLYRDGEKLVGHMARKNPFKDSDMVKVIFHGPQTYINSSWYAQNNVPTWNYVVVHVDGKLTLVEDVPGIMKILMLANDHMNELYEDKWDMYVPADLRGGKLSDAIVGFEISVDVMEGKFKLSQNRNEADYAGVLVGLAKRTDEMSHKVLEMMTPPKKG